jgi:hypothetical protein
LYEKCATLTEYAVHTRYPDEKQLEKQDMDKALEYAQSIKEFVQSQFSEQFKLYGDNTTEKTGES